MIRCRFFRGFIGVTQGLYRGLYKVSGNYHLVVTI